MKMFNSTNKRFVLSIIAIVFSTIAFLYTSFNTNYSRLYIKNELITLTQQASILIENYENTDLILDVIDDSDINVVYHNSKNGIDIYKNGFNTPLSGLKENDYLEITKRIQSSKKDVIVLSSTKNNTIYEGIDYNNLDDINHILIGKLENNLLIILEKKVENADNLISLNQLILKSLFLQILITSALVTTFFVFINKSVFKRLKKDIDSLSLNSFSKRESTEKEYVEIVSKVSDLVSEYQKVDRYQKDLVANVSHDLKTPLTLINSYSELMIDRPEELTVENVMIIQEEAKRLNQFVNDLLDLSKLQSTSSSLEITEFSLTDLIKETINNLTKFDKSLLIDLVIELDTTVKADRKKISQVLYNLINNSINYTNKNKGIQVKISKVDKKALVEIIDFGEGISKDELKLVFERYYKSKKNHKTSTNGSGIGLSIVKEVLTLHQLEFGVKSSSKGSNFYFYLNI